MGPLFQSSPGFPLPPPAETIEQRLQSQEMSNSLPRERVYSWPTASPQTWLSSERCAGAPGSRAGSRARPFGLQRGGRARRAPRVLHRSAPTFLSPPQLPGAGGSGTRRVWDWGATQKSGNRCSDKGTCWRWKGRRHRLSCCGRSLSCKSGDLSSVLPTSITPAIMGFNLQNWLQDFYSSCF